MEEKYFIDLELTDLDHYRINLILMWRSKNFRRAVAIILLPFVVYFLILAGPVDVHLPYLFIYPAVVLFVAFVGPIIIIKLTKKRITHARLLFDDWGMLMSGQGFEHKKSWKEFDYWIETGSYLLLFMPNIKSNAYVVQKDKFNSLEDLNKFKIFLSAHLRKK